MSYFTTARNSKHFRGASTGFDFRTRVIYYSKQYIGVCFRVVLNKSERNLSTSAALNLSVLKLLFLCNSRLEECAWVSLVTRQIVWCNCYCSARFPVALINHLFSYQLLLAIFTTKNKMNRR